MRLTWLLVNIKNSDAGETLPMAYNQNPKGAAMTMAQNARKWVEEI